MSFSAFHYQVIHIQPLSKVVSALTLQPQSSVLSYLAGQYIHVLHDDGQESPISIACAPSLSHQIQLHIGHPAKNLRGLDIMRMAQSGSLRINGPYGSCTLAKLLPDTPVIFYVRGTGFAPAKAILEELLQSHFSRPIHLFWGTPDEKDFYMAALLQNWEQEFKHFRDTPIVSRTVDQYKLRDAVVQLYPDLSFYQVYASGPPDMVHSALLDFQQHGLRPERFYSDVTG